MIDFSQLTTSIRVEALTEPYTKAVALLAQQLALPLTGETAFALQLGDAGLQLQALQEKHTGALRVDFIEGTSAHRRKFGGGKGQMIAKAVGIQTGIIPTILDATAGLGGDAFVLATLGCTVTLLERNPIVAALLKDGLKRALMDAETAAIVENMHFIQGDSIKLMQDWQHEIPQIIYLDPMFPHRDKSALVKKEMRLFRPFVGDDQDAGQLLIAALALASHRVVVKRPRKAPCIEGANPSYSLEGKSSRYDIYVKKSLKKES